MKLHCDSNDDRDQSLAICLLIYVGIWDGVQYTSETADIPRAFARRDLLGEICSIGLISDHGLLPRKYLQ